MYKSVIFDFGNVIHTLGNYNSRKDIADAFNLDINEISEIIKPFVDDLGSGNIDEETFWKSLSKELEHEVPKNWHGIWRKVKEHIKLYEKVIELVKEIKKKNIKTFVLSNTIQPHEDILRELGWYDYFDKVYLSHKIKMRKPNIKIYEYVLKDNDLKAEECIFIDDLEENIIPAKELGIKTILAKTEDQIVRDLKEMLNFN